MSEWNSFSIPVNYVSIHYMCLSCLLTSLLNHFFLLLMWHCFALFSEHYCLSSHFFFVFKEHSRSVLLLLGVFFFCHWQLCLFLCCCTGLRMKLVKTTFMTSTFLLIFMRSSKKWMKILLRIEFGFHFVSLITVDGSAWLNCCYHELKNNTSHWFGFVHQYL